MPVVAKGGALDELQRMREEGLIHFIGLGVRQHEFHEIAIRTGVVDVILTYLDYTLLNQSASQTLMPIAKENDIGIIYGSPIAMGPALAIQTAKGHINYGVGHKKTTSTFWTLLFSFVCVNRSLILF